MRVLAAFACLMLVTACQTAPPEMTEAEIDQIESEVVATMEAMFEGWRQGDVDAIMSVFHPTATAWAWSSDPMDFARLTEYVENWWETHEKWEGSWVETMVKVLNPDAAMFQGRYEITISNSSGTIVKYPSNATWTALVERTGDGWKTTTGANTAGGGRRLDPIYGAYDIISFFGEDWTTPGGVNGTFELRDGGVAVLTVNSPGQPQEVTEVQYSFGNRLIDGCLVFLTEDDEGTEYDGTICDEAFTIEGPDGTAILRKRG